MGANIKIQNKNFEAGELVADLLVCYSPNLVGVEVPEHRSARMIDEYPILSILAATAKGPTIMKGIEELRFKESDWIEAIADTQARWYAATLQPRGQDADDSFRYTKRYRSVFTEVKPYWSDTKR